MFSEQGVTDHRCEGWIHTSFWNVLYVGASLFIKNNVNIFTMLVICARNHNRRL